MATKNFPAAADAIRQRANAQMELIRADQTLSAEGRKAHMAAVWLKANDQLAAVRGERDEAIAAERQRLRLLAFGSPAGREGEYRQALLDLDGRLDRVEEAHRLLKRADRTGDMMLARAVGTIAAEKSSEGANPLASGWGEVMRVAAGMTGASQVIADLADLDAATAGIGNQFAADMTFRLYKPSELQKVDQYAMKRLAAKAPASDSPVLPSFTNGLAPTPGAA